MDCAPGEYISYQQHREILVFGKSENVFQMEVVKRPAGFLKLRFKFVFEGNAFYDWLKCHQCRSLKTTKILLQSRQVDISAL